MPAVPPLISLTGYNAAQGGFNYGAPRLSLDIGPFAILTAGSGANVQVQAFVLPANISDFTLESIEFWAPATAGTIVAATFDLKCNAVSILTAPIALVGLTGPNILLRTLGPATATVNLADTVVAAQTLILSQTVNSANAATLCGRIHLALVPDNT